MVEIKKKIYNIIEGTFLTFLPSFIGGIWQNNFENLSFHVWGTAEKGAGGGTYIYPSLCRVSIFKNLKQVQQDMYSITGSVSVVMIV